MEPLLVGLDVGTTSSKVAVFTAQGECVSTGRCATPWSETEHGAQADAGELAASAVEALNQAMAGAPQGEVLALGVTSMGEAGVLLDRHGVPVAPVIAWYDRRDRVEVEALQANVGADRFAEHTGLPLRGQWSLTKHLWTTAHHPDARRAVRRLNVAEWIVRSLGGDEATEQSLASRTGFLELGSRRWWTEALDWAGASESLMPDLVTGGTPLGRVAATAAHPRLQGAVLTLAGHDHQAATIGAGVCGVGDELDSCGTAEALVRTISTGLEPLAVGALAAAGVTTGWHVLADRWCLLGGTQGGLALQRVLGLLGRTSEDVPQLDEQALLRERTRLAVEGVNEDWVGISGIGSDSRPADLWLSALEAVTAEAAAVHGAMSELAGPHRRLVVAGGWARSSGLLEIKRRSLGPFCVASESQAGARGAALLGGLAAGLYSDLDDAVGLDSERTP
jgi:sugar (pentulose or hexulose) kinase